MFDNTELAALSAREYLEHFHVEFYIRDALATFLARKRNDGRSAPEVLEQYFDSVLRGEHVVNRGFDYVSRTPQNRRSFVSLLRRGLRGVPNPHYTALTVGDFHDLVAPCCDDFPVSMVEEAAQYAEFADAQRHRLLTGEHLAEFDHGVSASSDPVGAAASRRGGQSRSAPSSSSRTLFVFASLQRNVEFCFVYAELLTVVRRLFRGPSKSGRSTGTVSRQELVAEIRRHLRKGALAKAPQPSELALMRLMQPCGLHRLAGEHHGTGSAQPISLTEAVACMAECFELDLSPSPQDWRSGAP